MKQEFEAAISRAVQELWGETCQVELTRPEARYGDYATNVILQLAKRVGRDPRELAEALAETLRSTLSPRVLEVTVAGPGFLNLRLSDDALLSALTIEPEKSLSKKTIVAEYSDPNPFKVLHAGHLYTSVVGDAIANLCEAAGGNVHRVNFGGDVGLHVAKTIWAILFHETAGQTADEALALAGTKRYETEPLAVRAAWLADNYVAGTAAYENDAVARDAIPILNKRIYELVASNDHDSLLAQIYWLCRTWSYEYFDAFYERIGTHFEKYYPESETAALGLATVKAHVGDVFEESDGAVIFNGETYGLHTRVFINSQGLPTYEAKDVGLSMKKWQDYHPDLSIIITGNDQLQYMAVVLKAIEQFEPDLAHTTRHLTHGIVKLEGGVKMSSRLGNILQATDVLDAAASANAEAYEQNQESITLGAVKYAFLKQRIGADIVYNPVESVSLEGNSGPYLQYAHARARSILTKASELTAPLTTAAEADSLLTSRGEVGLEPGERLLARKIAEYPEVVNKAVDELMPHHICTFLYELAQEFNRFYEHNRVIGDERAGPRLGLVWYYGETLKVGLGLLGIVALDKM
jgi:arginyl-tRNA synthetase